MGVRSTLLLITRMDKCAICGCTDKRLTWDHDHVDGDRLRGRLCFRCNSYLGWFENHAVRIITYISHPPMNGSYREEVRLYQNAWGRRRYREKNPVVRRRLREDSHDEA